MTDNLVTNRLRYFNLFKCGKNILNRLDATYKQACVSTSREIYYTEIYNTLPDYNERKNTPLWNEKIYKKYVKSWKRNQYSMPIK